MLDLEPGALTVLDRVWSFDCVRSRAWSFDCVR